MWLVQTSCWPVNPLTVWVTFCNSHFVFLFSEMVNLTTRLCWKLVKKEGYIAIWQKPFNNSCYLSRELGTLPPICDPDDDPDNVWYILYHLPGFIYYWYKLGRLYWPSSQAQMAPSKAILHLYSIGYTSSMRCFLLAELTSDNSSCIIILGMLIWRHVSLGYPKMDMDRMLPRGLHACRILLIGSKAYKLMPTYLERSSLRQNQNIGMK